MYLLTFLHKNLHHIANQTAYFYNLHLLNEQPNWETDEILAYTIWERDLENINLTELCLEGGYEFSLDVNISGTVVVQSTLDASIVSIDYQLYELDVVNNINLIYSVNMLTTSYAIPDDMTPVSIPFSYAI